MTCTAHLARSLVELGDRLERGQPYAISGYSGLDSLVTFPWGTPHIHYNVWLNGEPVDPFPHHGEASMWRAGELPLPDPAERDGDGDGDGDDEDWAPSDYDDEAVEAVIDRCVTPSVRQRLRAVAPGRHRAAELIAELNYYPTRFPGAQPRVYAAPHARQPVLDLPLSANDFDGVVFVDDLP